MGLQLHLDAYALSVCSLRPRGDRASASQMVQIWWHLGQLLPVLVLCALLAPAQALPADWDTSGASSSSGASSRSGGGGSCIFEAGLGPEPCSRLRWDLGSRIWGRKWVQRVRKLAQSERGV